MSRRYNCKHPLRSLSHYPQRLAKRGLSKAPSLGSLPILRARQIKRVKETGYPWPTSKAQPDKKGD